LARGGVNVDKPRRGRKWGRGLMETLRLLLGSFYLSTMHRESFYAIGKI